MDSGRLLSASGQRQGVLQEILKPQGGRYQRNGGRQTEYHRPRFSSFHFGSAQSFLRSAAEAVGSAGGVDVELEEHAAAAIARARIPDLTSASFTSRRDNRTSSRLQ